MASSPASTQPLTGNSTSNSPLAGWVEPLKGYKDGE
jgi:hypothetical protein